VHDRVLDFQRGLIDDAQVREAASGALAALVSVVQTKIHLSNALFPEVSIDAQPLCLYIGRGPRFGFFFGAEIAELSPQRHSHNMRLTEHSSLATAF
jgi:hypothetical protein